MPIVLTSTYKKGGIVRLEKVRLWIIGHYMTFSVVHNESIVLKLGSWALALPRTVGYAPVVVMLAA